MGLLGRVLGCQPEAGEQLGLPLVSGAWCAWAAGSLTWTRTGHGCQMQDNADQAGQHLPNSVQHPGVWHSLHCELYQHHNHHSSCRPGTLTPWFCGQTHLPGE